MDFSDEYMTNVYTIPIENVGKYHLQVNISDRHAPNLGSWGPMQAYISD